MKAPLLVPIDLLGDGSGPVSQALLPALAELNRSERPLVLLAERPDRWRPTRNQVDQALSRQSSIEETVHRAGGAVDAVLYLDVGLFSRERHRREALQGLAERYDLQAADLRIVAAPGRLGDLLRRTDLDVVGAADMSELVDRIRTLAREE
ncbi:MAG: hypothetical protein R3323_02790 [Wenzhouxiangellaceae bacterium]|nr:hypothetical protein [Wenzhouxiangellaceae bacterium]